MPKQKPKKIFVKPRIAGAIIRDPQSHVLLPVAGGWVPNNNYWNRRLIQDDVTPTDPPKAEPKPKGKK